MKIAGMRGTAGSAQKPHEARDLGSCQDLVATPQTVTIGRHLPACAGAWTWTSTVRVSPAERSPRHAPVAGRASARVRDDREAPREGRTPWVRVGLPRPRREPSGSPRRSAGPRTRSIAPSRTWRSGLARRSIDSRATSFTGVERLGQIVVGADLEADDLADVVIPRCEHQNRYVGALAHAPTDVDLVQIAHEVEKRQHGASAAACSIGLLAGTRHAHGKARALDMATNEAMLGSSSTTRIEWF